MSKSRQYLLRVIDCGCLRLQLRGAALPEGPPRRVEALWKCCVGLTAAATVTTTAAAFEKIEVCCQGKSWVMYSGVRLHVQKPAHLLLLVKHECDCHHVTFHLASTPSEYGLMFHSTSLWLRPSSCTLGCLRAPQRPRTAITAARVAHTHPGRTAACLPAGQVSWSVISVYIRAMGGWHVFAALALWFLLAEVCRVGATVWLSHWTGVADMPGALASSWMSTLELHCRGSNNLTLMWRHAASAPPCGRRTGGGGARLLWCLKEFR